ncbi:MAG: DUF6247 family protein [Sporichthyaceae bacterium]
MPVSERPFSDLLRRPGEVTADVESGDVLLRRRDEPDLRLTRADREADRSSAFAALGGAFRHLVATDSAAAVGALGEAFPWIEFLPATQRRAFVREFSRVLVACADLDNYAPLGQTVREWRATAEVHADPALARRLRRPVAAAGGPVEPPSVDPAR